MAAGLLCWSGDGRRRTREWTTEGLRTHRASDPLRLRDLGDPRELWTAGLRAGVRSGILVFFPLDAARGCSGWCPPVGRVPAVGARRGRRMPDGEQENVEPGGGVVAL